MPRFGVVPPEVPVSRSPEGCAPRFVEAVNATLRELDGGPVEFPFEWLRTEARQKYLIGFGRDYDDGRGIVTGRKDKRPVWWLTWHVFGLAVDVVEKDATPWSAPPTFWNRLGEAGERNGLAWGGRWKRADLPHLQWGECPLTPTADDLKLFREKGVTAVWQKYNAA